jgi:dihydroorotate dehydrogenase
MLLDKLLVNSRLIISGGLPEKILVKTIDYEPGAITLGTYSSEFIATHPPPWIAKVFDDCLANAYGVRKTIMEATEFMKEAIRKAKDRNISVICSFLEKNHDRIKKAVDVYHSLGCDIIELNPMPLYITMQTMLPDEKSFINLVSKIIKTIKEQTTVPVSIKFPGFINKVADAWRSWKSSGCDIAHVMNAVIPATYLAPPNYKPLLGSPSGLGGLTGRCIKPIAIARVMQLRNSGETEIIGTGGVIEQEDVREMINAGAKAVGIHSVIYLKGLDQIKKLIEATRE